MDPDEPVTRPLSLRLQSGKNERELSNKPILPVATSANRMDQCTKRN